MNPRTPALVTLSLAAAAFAAQAAPADDHQRGVTAYARGDVVGAMSALRSAASAGHAPSQVLLAHILDQADFAEEAASLYRQAAEQGDAEGLLGLGRASLTGRGIAKDEKAALQHFSKAAALGHAAAIEAVAEAYVRGQLGLGQAPDDEALAAVRRAAERGHLVSIDALAQAHRTGRWGLAVDAAQAADWRSRAARLRAERAAVKPPVGKGS